MKLSHLNKIARIIIPAFLLVVMCFITNATINQHFHKLSTGIVVNHAHPFDKSSSKTGTPFQEHHHDSSELVLLELISVSPFRLYLLIILLISLPVVYRAITIRIPILYKAPELYFLKNYHAPPSPSY